MDESGRSPTDEELERLRFPIGRFEPSKRLSGKERDALVDDIAALPADLRAAVSDLSPAQVGTPYRPGGWTVRQVVNHLPDSHMNGYIRFKLAVTEDEPTIKPYDEAAWANLADGRAAKIEHSLRLLEALHKRWVRFLRSLEDGDFSRTFRHPELGSVSLSTNLELYAWHGRHHLAHIEELRRRKGW